MGIALPGKAPSKYDVMPEYLPVGAGVLIRPYVLGTYYIWVRMSCTKEVQPFKALGRAIMPFHVP